MSISGAGNCWCGPRPAVRARRGSPCQGLRSRGTVERRQDNPCDASDASACLVECASRSCSDGNARPGSVMPHGLSRTPATAWKLSYSVKVYLANSISPLTQDLLDRGRRLGRPATPRRNDRVDDPHRTHLPQPARQQPAVPTMGHHHPGPTECASTLDDRLARPRTGHAPSQANPRRRTHRPHPPRTPTQPSHHRQQPATVLTPTANCGAAVGIRRLTSRRGCQTCRPPRPSSRSSARCPARP